MSVRQSKKNTAKWLCIIITMSVSSSIVESIRSNINTYVETRFICHRMSDMANPALGVPL